MKLIVGLGNYPVEYTKTRHNVGFLFLDFLQNKYEGTSFRLKKDLRSEISEVFVDGEKWTLVKPQTYMNLSGEALGLVQDYFDVDVDDIWFVYDDIDMTFPKIRYRSTGRSGGHNGVKSITKTLGGDTFHRIKIGVGNDQLENIPTEAFVLQRFDDEEWDQLPIVFNETERLLKEKM